MTTISPPFEEESPYVRKKWGYYGELGEGANAKVRFVQTVINHEELDDITIISNIPGSEKWDVRDLFQRDVDDERVTNEIMPYFRDESKVKFFNPLTLVILPMDENYDVLKEIEYSEPKTELEDGREYEVYEKEGFYKFRIHKESEAFAQVQWNDKKCYIVAIDGQHRLSGLKRWKRAPRESDQLSSWRIPVVILNIHKASQDVETANLLEIVRKTFVYINSQAIVVNTARKILLNDESVNAICTQEVIQYTHWNDSKPHEERDKSILPLMFFDWRGETKNRIRLHGPAAVKTIEEIHEWFRYYILDEDGYPNQEIQLNLTDLVPPLQGFGEEKALSHEDAERIRGQFQETVLPGFLYFLQNFEPYREYIEECRNIEKGALEKSDLAQHAFMKLRFGSHNASEDQLEAVNEEFETLVEKFENLKNKTFPEILNRDIGMRGIIYAFATCKSEYEEIINDSMSWYDYSVWILDSINEIYDERWFESFANLERFKRQILTHVTFDESGSIINYKFKDVENALGALLVLLILHDKVKKGEIEKDSFDEIWNTYSLNVAKPIERGFRKSIRAELRDTFEGKQVQFNKVVNEKAEKATKKRTRKLAKYLDISEE